LAPRASIKPPQELLFLLICCLWCLVFFSAADCKRIGYLLPAMPPLALALGYALDRRLEHGIVLPLWTNRAVLMAGICGALLAAHDELLEPEIAAVLVAVGIIALVYELWRRPSTPRAAWTRCSLATFALLFVGVTFISPNYYRRFSMADEIRFTASADHGRLPIACYPHHWDSIGYYLQRDDVRVYDRGSRKRLAADLQERPATLVFVKTGKALNELLEILPPGVEFAPCGQARTVTAGVVRRRSTTQPPAYLIRAESKTSPTATENSGFSTDFAASPRR
jgi:hypothetical protein